MRSNLGFTWPGTAKVAFTPTDITGLAAWYDAADTSTIADTAGAVDSWADKSGNSRTLTATLTARPTTGTRTQNGRNVLDFDGAANTMVAASAFTQGTSDTVFVVALNDDGADATAQFAYMANSATPYCRVLKTATDVWRITSGTSLDGGTPDTSAHVLGGVFGGASSELRLDGASLATGSAGTNSASVAPRVGATATPGSFWDGWIAEIIHYDSVLTAGDITTVEAYLRAKWSI